MQPTRREGSGFARWSSRVEHCCALVAGGCLARPAALKAGASALVRLVLSCQYPRVGVGTCGWLVFPCFGVGLHIVYYSIVEYSLVYIV